MGDGGRGRGDLHSACGKGRSISFGKPSKLARFQAGKDFKVAVSFDGPENDTMYDKQINMLFAVNGQASAGAGLAACDSIAATPLLKKAQKSNLPVIARFRCRQRHPGDHGDDQQPGGGGGTLPTRWLD